VERYISDKVVAEKSAIGIRIMPENESGGAVIPTACTWTLTDMDGVVINSRNAVVITPLSSSMTVWLSASDLAITEGHYREARLFTVEATCNGLPWKRECLFYVANLVAVA